MPVFSNNKKFLVLVLALVASALVVEAGGVRSRRKERNLKSTKSTKSGSYDGSQNTTPAETFNVIYDPPVVDNANTVESFGQNCPAKENALSSCVSSNGGSSTDLESCKICLVGISNMQVVTHINVKSCSDPDVAGGRCRECYSDALAYYNCGADDNIGASVTADPNSVVVGGGSTPTTGGSTPTTGGSTGGDAVVTMPAPGSYAPNSVCPSAVPESGVACDTEGYDFLKCFYPLLKCTCRKDSPFFLCNDFDPSNPNPNGGR